MADSAGKESAGRGADATPPPAARIAPRRAQTKPVLPEPPAPSAEAVREQLERILASSHFAAAERGRKFLRFLVEETLEGRSSRLKEYTLATEVFDRDEAFDPTTNPTVRVEASRLRRRLEHYYLTVGRADPVLIQLARGTYVPVFRPQADVLGLHDELSALGRTGGKTVQRLRTELPSGPSIAVLPFDALGNPGDELLGDGITVEIITALSRFREFHVLGRNTAFLHRSDTDPVQIGQALGVRYVLRGSVRRDAEQIRVNVELSNCTNGMVLWAEGYARDLSTGSIFAVQEEIAARVVATIAQPEGVIVRPDLTQAKRKPLDHLDTYECVLLFYDYDANLSPDRHARARAALDRALEKEPDSSTVWAARSQLYTDMFRFRFNVEGSRKEALDKALQAARNAVKLDPHNPMAYHSLFVVRHARGEMRAFREAGNRAIELNPNNTDILADYGLHLITAGKLELGSLFIKMALSLNPEPPDWYWFAFFSLHFQRGEFEAALDMALRAENTDFYWTHCIRAVAYASLGMAAEARAAAARVLAVYPDFEANARDDLSCWISPERVEHQLATLREMGLKV